MEEIPTMKKKILMPSVLMAGLLGTGAFHKAHAAGPISGVPTIVRYHAAGSPYATGGSLDVVVGGVNYWVQPSNAINPACSANAQTVDTVKMVATLAQSAMLAGKQLRIEYTSCGGLRYLNVVEFLP
jgi:hypothetical protein